jgi:iron complex outermembrane receptor protein
MFNNRVWCLKTTFLATSMLTLGSGIAYAQDAGSQEETVVVTGSRINIAGFTAPTPVTSVNAASIAERAPGDIADILNTIPQFRLTLGNGQQPTANFNGQNQVDLRGLGVNRTLVLLDGQRFVPTNTNSSVDTNSIPVLLLSSVQIVTGGASAAYGSDAVAGVVNFITRDRLEGVIGNVGFGISERGDNEEHTVNIAAGHSFFGDRLHEVASLEYVRNGGVSNEYSRMAEYGSQQTCLVAPTAAQRAAGNLPSQTYQDNCTFSQLASSTLVLSGKNAAGANVTTSPISNLTFGPGGTVIPFNVGTVSGSLMYGGLPNYTDPHANQRSGLAIEEPHKSVKFYDKMTFDIDADTSAFVQLNWADNQTIAVNSGIPQYTPIIIPITGPFANPYVPAALQSAAIAAGFTALNVGRDELSTGGQVTESSDVAKRLGVGVKGKIFGDWSWDLFYTHGETSSKASNAGFSMVANYIESIFAVAGPGGAPVCGPVASNPNFVTGAIAAGRTAQVLPGCQPYNIFGPTLASYIPAGFKCYACTDIPEALRVPTGSQGAVNYFTITNQSGTHYQQDYLSGVVNGQPITLWAGPVSLAAGMEYRREGARTFTGPFAGAAGYSLNSGAAPFAGSFSTAEGFFEVNVPLLKGVPLVQSLSTDIAFRETGYSLFGTLPTYKVGLDWQINDDWRVRASRSRDVREPSISDLFAATSVAINTSFNNPFTHTFTQEYTQTGGSLALKPEVAASTTIGIVYTPSGGWFEGLNASLDWYKIDIQKVIVAQNPQVIAQQCAAGVAAYCALVDPTGGPSGILLIKSVTANLNVLKQSGVDLELSYGTPLDSIDLPGTLTGRLLGTFTDYNTQRSVSTLEFAGSAQGQPKYSGSFNLTYALGPSSTNFQFRYTSGLLADATLIGPGQSGYDPTLSNSVNQNQFPAAYYIDFAENYDFYSDGNLKFTAFLNVNNLLDKDPPGRFRAVIAFLAGGDPYDLIGRTFKAGIRFKF